MKKAPKFFQQDLSPDEEPSEDEENSIVVETTDNTNQIGNSAGKFNSFVISKN